MDWLLPFCMTDNRRWAKISSLWPLELHHCMQQPNLTQYLPWKGKDNEFFSSLIWHNMLNWSPLEFFQSINKITVLEDCWIHDFDGMETTAPSESLPVYWRVLWKTISIPCPCWAMITKQNWTFTPLWSSSNLKIEQFPPVFLPCILKHH